MRFLRSFFVVLIATSAAATAQVRIDSSFAFSINPAKKYSLYIPSSYNASVPNALVVGFHPLNVTRWNSTSWCDTLKAFAEANNVILACPDGDANGDITDPIDYDFTTALIDSVKFWYNIHPQRVYALGFSIGGKAVYEYGLQHTDVLKGFIPIGPAVNGSSFVSSTIHNAGRRPFYLIHGALDAPTQGYYPMLSALRSNCAYVDSLLMPGVNHTIDFPNRNAILGDAYFWVDSVNMSPKKGVFSLIAPISFTNLDVKGFFDNYLDFEWEASSIADTCGVMKYEIMADIPGGSFSTPLFTMPSGNGGRDTSLRLSFLQLDSILSSYGVTANNVLTFDWTVRSILHNQYSDTAKAFRLSLVRRRIGFKLLTPATNQIVMLKKNDTRTFDWEDMLHFVPVQYELQFADTAGNFGVPLASLSSGTNGTASFLGLTHEELYDKLMFGKGYNLGDSLITKWSARAFEGPFSEYAQTERVMIFIKDDVGFDLFEPVDQSILISKKDVGYTFSWDSVYLDNIQYEIRMDTVGGDLENSPTVQKTSDAGGSMAFVNLDFPWIDSVMNIFGIAYEDTMDGIWTVMATNPDGSEFALNTFSIKIYRNLPVGMGELYEDKDVSVYPNPACNHVIVRWNELQPEKIYLLGFNGERLEEIYPSSDQTEVLVPTQDLNAGLYFIEFVTGKEVIRERLVISR